MYLASALAIVFVVNLTILSDLIRSQEFYAYSPRHEGTGDVINVRGVDMHMHTKATGQSPSTVMVIAEATKTAKPAIERAEFYPVDAGQQGAYWPVIPDEHWNFMPRIYSPWNSTAISWCGDFATYDNQTKAGLIYAKVHKAASSTLAGITLRVAKNYGRRRTKSASASASASACATLQGHANSQVYHERDRTRSFMFSSIRHPASRAVSWVFYVLSGQQVPIQEESVLASLRAGQYFPPGGRIEEDKSNYRYTGEAGAQVGFMHTGPRVNTSLWSREDPTKVRDLSLAIARVSEVLDQYDLIIIVERLHESLVVFQLLLGLDTSDILYISAKQSGAYSASTTKRNPVPVCHVITKSFTTPEIADHLSSPTWYARNYEDYLLYKAANRSLDLTIDSLGRQRFEEALAQYENMMKGAKVCENETITPCTSEGVYLSKTDCYAEDFGCGYPCLDRLFGR